MDTISTAPSGLAETYLQGLSLRHSAALLLAIPVAAVQEALLPSLIRACSGGQHLRPVVLTPCRWVIDLRQSSERACQAIGIGERCS